ncbi:Ig-like domain-containing protein [Arthrobacter sp. GMC3]|uniref:Ig-like domain-containing protein n=1 Tax=Arthrobacter sp. GMC3 TaxID=2058894 RepID=UPI000CE469C5|nr:Ig-like domain-containing protein [Arthrobacter sp. GMC3]
MAKLKEPALLRAAGGVIATAMVALSVTAVGLAPAQAATPAPAPITKSVVGNLTDSFMVPAGVTKILVTAKGGAGGNGAGAAVGGSGAIVSAIVQVAQGDQVKLQGASQGANTGLATAGLGYAAGGSGGGGSSLSIAKSGGGGGGAAAVLVNGDARVVASGGGGAGGAGGAGCLGGVGANAALAGTAGTVAGGVCAGKGAAGAAVGGGINGGTAGAWDTAGGGGGAGGGHVLAGGGGAGRTGGGGGGGGGAGSSFLGLGTSDFSVFSGSKGAGSVTISYTVDTNTTVTASPNPTFVGDTIAYTINTTVAGAATPVSGPFSLYAGACGTGALLRSGNLINGTATVDALANASVCATFGGSEQYNGSEGTAAVTINLKPTTTTVTASPNPALVGQEVAYTVTTVVEGTATRVDGDFTLYAGVCGSETVLKTGTLVNGTATFNAPANANVCASFAGTATHAASDGALPLQVNKDVTTTDVWLPSNPTYGETDYAYIDVYRTNNTWATPSGTVTYSWNGGPAQTGTLNEWGYVELAIPFMSAGTHTLTASYGGDASFKGSEDASETTVSAVGTSVSLSSSVNASNVGQETVFTATVTAEQASEPSDEPTLTRAQPDAEVPPVAEVDPAMVPTGSIVFSIPGKTLGTVALLNGVAALPISNLLAGTNQVTATFVANGNFAQSASEELAQVVNKLPTAAVLSVSPSPSNQGDIVTATATISGALEGQTLTGTVQFSVGGKTVGDPIAVSNGQAAVGLKGLALGSSNITAVYSGDATYLGSEAASQTAVVNPATSTTKPVTTTTAKVVAKVPPLAKTGVENAGLLTGGLGLLALGMTLVLVRRRRTSTHS